MVHKLSYGVGPMWLTYVVHDLCSFKHWHLIYILLSWCFIVTHVMSCYLPHVLTLRIRKIRFIHPLLRYELICILLPLFPITHIVVILMSSDCCTHILLSFSHKWILKRGLWMSPAYTDPGAYKPLWFFIEVVFIFPLLYSPGFDPPTLGSEVHLLTCWATPALMFYCLKLRVFLSPMF